MTLRITEEMLEDWVCENLPAVVGRRDVRLVGRQVRVPGAGILDVLTIHNGGDREYPHFVFTVIELKSVTVGCKAVSQCLRYMGALKRAWAPLAMSRSNPSGLSFQVDGVVAGPGLRTEAGHMLNALPQVSYCRLVVGLAADRWVPGWIDHQGLEEEREQSRDFMRSVVDGWSKPTVARERREAVDG